MSVSHSSNHLCAPTAARVPRPGAGATAHPVPDPVVCYSVQAVAEPGVMPRVLELFAKRNVVPKRWVSDVAGSGDRELFIDVQVAGLDRHTGDYLARCLRQIHGVTTVLTSEKSG